MIDPDRRIAVGLFILTFVTYAYFFGGGGWNQNANFDLTRAIVERGTFAIDDYRENTYDVSFHGGRTYANKAPGVSLLAVVPYAICYGAGRALGVDLDSFAAQTVNMWICTVAVCATSGALLISLLFLYGRRIGAPPARALTIALVAAFGTYLFAYSTVFFAHVPGALFLFWSFVRLERPARASALAAAAVVCNYAVLPAAVIIAIATLLAPGDRVRRAGWMLAAGLPFAAFLMIYQTICFGGPFRTAVEATSGVFKTSGALFGVFVAPRLDAAVAILISRHRGLFILSPALIFAIAGAIVMIRRRVMLRELAVVVTIFLAFLTVNASFNNWEGGSAIGPRYILPVVPLLAVLILFGLDVMRPLFVALAAISIAFNFVVTAVNPLPSRTIKDPLFRYAVPLLLTGRLPADTPAHPPLAWKESLGHVSVNRHSADQFVPFMKHARGSRESEWASFNAGEIVAPGSPLSLLPIAIWMAGGSLLLARRARAAAES